MSFYAIAYLAKSTEDVKESLPSQLASITACLARQAEPRELVDHYSDENASAYESNRADGLRGPGGAGC